MNSSNPIVSQAMKTIENSICSSLERFQNERFGTVRVVMRNNDPWFVAKDIAACIDHSNVNKMCDLCRDKDKLVIKVSNESLETQQMFSKNTPTVTLISESGLYRILGKCDLPKCEPFESWVFDEVLPSIRKTGQYQLAPKTYAEALRALASEVEAREAAQKALEEEKEQHEADNRDFREGLEIVESRIQQEVFKQNAKVNSALGNERKKTKKLAAENDELRSENSELKEKSEYLERKNEEQDQYIPIRFKTAQWIRCFNHEPSWRELVKYSNACHEEIIERDLPCIIHGGIHVKKPIKHYHVRAWKLYEQYEWAHLSLDRPRLPNL